MFNAMRPFASCLRLLIVAIIALGLGLPAVAQTNTAHDPHAHHQMLQADPMAMPHQTPSQTPMDETCRQHCLGVAVLAFAAEAPPASHMAKQVDPVPTKLTHPSIAPAPEGHPPRA